MNEIKRLKEVRQQLDDLVRLDSDNHHNDPLYKALCEKERQLLSLVNSIIYIRNNDKCKITTFTSKVYETCKFTSFSSIDKNTIVATVSNYNSIQLKEFDMPKRLLETSQTLHIVKDNEVSR